MIYVRNEPFNEPGYFGIPGLIFHVKAIKFDTSLGLIMLFNMSTGFYHNH